MANELMTLQQVYDKVATHLLTQNALSFEDGSCLYRGPNGLKCGVGPLIPDDHYTEDMENCAVDQSIVWKALVAAYVIPAESEPGHEHYLEFLTDIQDLHDSTPVDRWPESLRKLASTYELSASVVDTLRRAE